MYIASSGMFLDVCSLKSMRMACKHIPNIHSTKLLAAQAAHANPVIKLPACMMKACTHNFAHSGRHACMQDILTGQAKLTGPNTVKYSLPGTC